ncbi:MAG: HNH endonuclease signature motif containing protein [Thermomicrobiales bacterium]
MTIEHLYKKCVINESTECIEWSKGRDKDGYGIEGVKRDGKWTSVRAHRLAWTVVHGEIPKGMFVCHECDNPSCINVAHLFLGTARDNSDDKVSKRRHLFGESSAFAKLTEREAIEVRASELPYDTIANQYHITRVEVIRIKQGKVWSHLDTPVFMRGIARGEACPNSKLTNDDVLTIKRLITEGVKHKVLAARFNVGMTIISDIRNGKKWSHLVLEV